MLWQNKNEQEVDPIKHQNKKPDLDSDPHPHFSNLQQLKPILKYLFMWHRNLHSAYLLKDYPFDTVMKKSMILVLLYLGKDLRTRVKDAHHTVQLPRSKISNIITRSLRIRIRIRLYR